MKRSFGDHLLVVEKDRSLSRFSGLSGAVSCASREGLKFILSIWGSQNRADPFPGGGHRMLWIVEGGVSHL